MSEATSLFDQTESALLSELFRMGARLREIRAQGVDALGTVIKDQDQSPQTIADRETHAALARFFDARGLDWVSEEHAGGSKSRIQAETWVCDPLDGTKEFIQGHADYAIALCRIRGFQVTSSMIHVPEKRVTYVAVRSRGAYRVSEDGACTRLTPTNASHGNFRLAVSRFHRESSVQPLAWPKDHRAFEVGACLKFAAIAEGQADACHRTKGGWAWDLLPGFLLVRESGGKVLLRAPLALESLDPTTQKLPGFIALGVARHALDPSLEESHPCVF